jgi:hypothetical protein
MKDALYSEVHAAKLWGNIYHGLQLACGKGFRKKILLMGKELGLHPNSHQIEA